MQPFHSNIVYPVKNETMETVADHAFGIMTKM